MLRRASVTSLRALSRQFRDQRLGGLARVADEPEVDRPVRADRLLVAVDLDQRGVLATSAPWRVVHMFSEAPKATITSASASSRCADRGREAAGDADRERVAGEQPVGHRGGGQDRAGQLAQAPQRRAGAGQHRAAAADDRGPLGARERLRDGLHGRRAGPAASSGPGQRLGRSISAACTSSGSISTTARRSSTARRTARVVSATAVAGPWTRSATAPTASTSASWSILKFERSCAAGVSAASRISGVRLLRRLGQPGDRVRQARALVHARHAEPPADTRA